MTIHYNPITVKDYIAAIRKNGLPQVRSQFYKVSEGEFVGACAVGQARVNLKLVKPLE